ncbi:O-antigen ligase family protein [bacterium 19MO03SA05]|uniref:O-antigen ligase family protein n=1 Tax=bacterium 19MO03SA05 TaxID=2920620 RepID=A0AAU6VCJ3_UNCXX|nr:O-antigen ligase family protein [Vibrio sp. A14(2019)]MDQ2194091.1 O-antigen ligase family protein [Vibrio sp. A14(2019)]
MKIKEKFIQCIIFSPYLFLMAGINFIPNGDKKMVIFCLISIITSVIYYNAKYLKENIKNPALWICTLLAIYLSISYSIQDGSPSLLRAFLSAVLVMFFIPPLSNKNLLFLATLGAGCLFFNSVYQSFYLDHSRSAGLANVIPYATFCSTLFLIGIYFIIKNHDKKQTSLAIIIIILSTTSVILSLSRGVWLALVVATFAMIICQFLRSKKLWKYISIIFISGISILYLFKEPILDRAQETISEIHEIQNGNLNTSIGLRLQMWKASYFIAKENLLFGVGSQHQSILNKLYDTGKISNDLLKFQPQHYHNQLIDSMVKYGLIGVFFIILLYLSPIATSIYYKSDYTTLIVGISSLYLIAGLTDVPLNHSQTIYIYILFMVPLSSMRKTS